MCIVYHYVYEINKIHYLFTFTESIDTQQPLVNFL